MKTETRLWAFVSFLIALCCFLLIAPAWAGGDRITQSNDMNNQTTGDVSVSNKLGVNTGGNTLTGGTQTFSGGDVVGGDISIGGDKNRAYAVSNTLGDVDIAGCLGSTQWNTPIYGKQKLVLNWPCMAEFYLRNQKYELAAMAICNTEVLKEFATEAECEAAHDFEPVEVEPVAYMAMAKEDDDEEDHHKYEEQIAALAEQLKQTQIYAKDAQRVAYNTAKEPKVVIQKEEFITPQKRAELEAVRDETVD